MGQRIVAGRIVADRCGRFCRADLRKAVERRRLFFSSSILALRAFWVAAGVAAGADGLLEWFWSLDFADEEKDLSEAV